MRQKLMLTKRRCLKKVKIKVFLHAAPIQGAAIQNKGERMLALINNNTALFLESFFYKS